MTNDDIEWQYPRIKPTSVDGLYIHDDGDGLEIVIRHGSPDFEKYKIDAWDRNGIHGVIVIANAALPDDDQRKITLADVAGCRSIVACQPNDQTCEGTSPELASALLVLSTLADKLAALLPPEAK